MKVMKVASLISILLLLFYSASAQKPASNCPYVPGESLKYLMHYGIFDGGIATMKLTEEEIDGKKVYHSTAVGRTIGLANTLFKVYDVYESYFDPETCIPVKSIRNISEKKYRNYNVVLFNHQHRYLMSLQSGKRAYPDSIKTSVFDVVSAFYQARTGVLKNLKKNELVTFKTFFDDDFWLLQIIYKGVETIKTSKGKIQCLKFCPVVEPGRVFDSKEDVKIWISNDENMIPIRVQMDLFIGSFKADLVDFSGLKHELKFIK